MYSSSAWRCVWCGWLGCQCILKLLGCVAIVLERPQAAWVTSLSCLAAWPLSLQSCDPGCRGLHQCPFCTLSQNGASGHLSSPWSSSLSPSHHPHRYHRGRRRHHLIILIVIIDGIPWRSLSPKKKVAGVFHSRSGLHGKEELPLSKLLGKEVAR